MKKLTTNFLVVLLLFLIISGFFALFTEPFEEVKEISLTQLVKEINKGNVKKIVVAGSDLTVTFEDDTTALSRKEAEASLADSLINYGAEQAALEKVEVELKTTQNVWTWLSPLLLAFLPFLLLVVFFLFIFRQARTGTMKAFDFTKARARLFGADGSKPKEKVTFKDVAGLEEAKEELEEIVDFLKNPKKYLKMGARIPRGVLLMGPPGCGKTLLARAVATEANVPFFSIAGSEFIELFVGVGSSRTRDLFSTAKKHQPSIIFIDELDAIGRTRGVGVGGSHEEREQTLNQILVEMDGFEREAKTIVMAATNRADVLDPALLRPGRFDRRIVLDLPDLKEREGILKIHAQGKPLALDVKLKEVAERTPGFSGADLANLVNEAALLAARRNKKLIYQDELLESIEKVLLGPERKSHILSKKEKEIAAYHEAGHALVAALLPETEPVRKISIVSRGMAAGYTLKTPTEERKIRKKKEFLAEMAMLLGGYTAERLKFKEITTGAANDLKKASEIARRLVKEYGMSSLGPITFGRRHELVFLPHEFDESRNYSEELAALIDKEVAKFIKAAQKKAEQVLKKDKRLLEKTAKTLIKKEVIEKEEFEKIISKRRKRR